MTYRIELSRVAQKQLEKISERKYDLIYKKLLLLGREPRPRGAVKLTGSGLWRMRLGKYRVVYHIEDQPQIITVVRVARRSEDTYKRL